MNPVLVAQGSEVAECQWLIIGLFDTNGDGIEPLGIPPLDALIQRLAAQKDVAAAANELTVLYEPPGVKARSVLAVGLGKREKLDAGTAYTAFLAAAKRLSGKPRESVLLLPPSGLTPIAARAVIEGLMVGVHGPGLCKTEANRHEFARLGILIGEQPDPAVASHWSTAVERGRIIGNAINAARDAVNLPPADKTPRALAERLATLARSAGATAEIWDEKRLASESFGGLLGVAAGSDEPPRFLILDYKGADTPATALVGKGVTFDSGGLCIKPPASMEDMKSDMTGAAVVASAIAAVAMLQIPIHLRGYLPITENMTGGKAMRMGDVLTHRGGKTVEVLNTDAEGRLILADALAYAVEHKPTRILDLATLTGACMVALGSKIAGLFSNDDALRDQLLATSQLTGERAWPLPLDDDFKDQLKSQVADLKNVGNKWGGASTAAKFLQQFVGSVPWVHLDIAGPSWTDSDSPTRDAGGTGCFVRTLVTLAETWAAHPA
jgi:leucyl aminopeptidase